MTPFPPMVPPYTGQCIRTGRERAAFRRERIRYFITQKQIEVREPSGIHHFAAHGGTNKTPAHQAGVQQINPRERENEKRQSSQCNN